MTVTPRKRNRAGTDLSAFADLGTSFDVDAVTDFEEIKRELEASMQWTNEPTETADEATDFYSSHDTHSLSPIYSPTGTCPGSEDSHVPTSNAHARGPSPSVNASLNHSRSIQRMMEAAVQAEGNEAVDFDLANDPQLADLLDGQLVDEVHDDEALIREMERFVHSDLGTPGHVSASQSRRLSNRSSQRATVAGH